MFIAICISSLVKYLFKSFAFLFTEVFFFFLVYFCILHTSSLSGRSFANFFFFYQSVDCLFIFLTGHFIFFWRADILNLMKSNLWNLHLWFMFLVPKKSFLNQRSQIFFPMLSSSSFLHSGQRSISSNLYVICGKS